MAAVVQIMSILPTQPGLPLSPDSGIGYHYTLNKITGAQEKGKAATP
jgi:hypothetical protein